jgi:hypothetical protein
MKFYERKPRPVKENELGSIVGKGLGENRKYSVSILSVRN